MVWINHVMALATERPPILDERVDVARKVINCSSFLSNQITIVLSTGIDLYVQPPDSVAIASSLGATNALSASINNSCASFSTALDLISSKLKNCPHEIGVLTSSSIFESIHRREVFNENANGVGAAVISNIQEGFKVVKITHRNDCSFFGLKTIESDSVSTYRFNEQRDHVLWSSYREAAVLFPIEVLKEALNEQGWSISDVNHWLFHSSELTQQWAGQLNISVDDTYANMGALTSLYQLQNIFLKKDLRGKNKVVILEIGLGLSVGVVLLEN
jgi:3-oxoacyl-[acyl-carrier-protein] synthase III